jgi:DHA2 family multidrug resistance protein
VGKIILDRREQFHTLRLNESLDPLNPLLDPYLRQGQEFFMQHNGDPAAAKQMTLGILEGLRTQQALSLSYFDVFFVSAVVAVVLVFLVLLMRRSVAQKGAHISAE